MVKRAIAVQYGKEVLGLEHEYRREPFLQCYL
jgi:hypothetical protein